MTQQQDSDSAVAQPCLHGDWEGVGWGSLNGHFTVTQKTVQLQLWCCSLWKSILFKCCWDWCWSCCNWNHWNHMSFCSHGKGICLYLWVCLWFQTLCWPLTFLSQAVCLSLTLPTSLWKVVATGRCLRAAEACWVGGHSVQCRPSASSRHLEWRL